MKQTFDRLTWEIVVRQRPETTLVVDNLHAGGIIKDRTDGVWDAIRNLKEEDDQAPLLFALANLAASAQLVAEGLCLTEEQKSADDRESDAEKEAVKYKELFCSLVRALHVQKTRAAEFQIGVPRYSFEFNEAWLESLVQLTVDPNTDKKEEECTHLNTRYEPRERGTLCLDCGKRITQKQLRRPG